MLSLHSAIIKDMGKERRLMIIQKVKGRLIILYNDLGKYFWKKPNIKSIDETLDHINEKQCSVSRFGDGEFAVMLGTGYSGYQDFRDQLSKRLYQVLQQPIGNHIVCLPDIFGDLSALRSESIEFNRGVLGNSRRKYLDLIPMERDYYNTFFTRCYNMFIDKSNCPRWFEKCKSIWAGKDILIVEGEYSRLGVGNDLFAGAKSIQRILGPAQNAYDKYDELLKAAQQYGNDKLILVALGMTATVMAYDLAKDGYWAIDIGHIDVEYEWFLRGATKKVAIEGKFVNEAPGGRIVSGDATPEYWQQIICHIK